MFQAEYIGFSELVQVDREGLNPWEGYWIGLVDDSSPEDPSHFQWRSGQNASLDCWYENPWNAGEPNNNGLADEGCVEIIPNGKWNDNNCNDPSTNRRFVCEYMPHNQLNNNPGEGCLRQQFTTQSLDNTISKGRGFPSNFFSFSYENK